MFNFKKLFLYLAVALIVCASIFFFAFLIIFIIPILIIIMFSKKIKVGKKFREKKRYDNSFYQQRNDQKIIDVDYKKESEKDI